MTRQNIQAIIGAAMLVGAAGALAGWAAALAVGGAVLWLDAHLGADK